MNLCYFFVSNQNYKFVHSSDPIFGDQKKLSNWSLSSRSYLSDKNVWQRSCLSVKRDKQTKNENSNPKEPVWNFSKIFQANTLRKKRKNAEVSSFFLFQQWKNYLLKDLKKNLTSVLYNVSSQNFIHFLIHGKECPKVEPCPNWTIAALLILQTNWTLSFSETCGTH